MTNKRVTLPLDEAQALNLQAGDMVTLNGVLYTARDAAHNRLIAALERGEAPPFPTQDQVIYYVGPAPAKEGQVIGAAGPTTSGRMDPYTLAVLESGVRGFIGKGYRSAEIKEALVQYRAVYMAAIGGAAALLAQHIKESEVVAFADLGAEAIRRLVVEDFPVIVVNDCYGGDAYEAGRAQFAHSKGESNE